MDVRKRAILFLFRKKGKTIILLVMLTVIATLVLTCLSISRASEVAGQNLRETMGGYFKIETDYEQGKRQPADDAIVGSIVDSGGIKAFNGMDIYYLHADGLELEPGRFSTQGDSKAHLARFLGNTDSSLHEYFILRSFVLKEGTHIFPDDTGKAIISDVLAQRNNLSLGDTFTAAFGEEQTLENPKATDTQFVYEVAGIFKINSPQNRNTNSAECDIAENFIFTDTASARTVAEAALGRDTKSYKLGASFFVEDPKELDSIVAGLTKIPGYDWNEYKITKNNKTYNDSAVPLERMSGLISTIMLIIIIVSIVLLSLILTIWMRDRVHEIGILLSIGLKKTSIILQHIIENLLIAVVAFLLSWGISAFAADKAGSLLLGNVKEQTEVTVEQQSEFQLFYDPVEQEQNQTETLVNIRVGIGELLEILGIGFLVVTAATGISSINIIRMKPKNILSSMS